MTRVRVPNASLIASADLPILPFLAPRVFADSPIPPRRSKQQHHGNSHDTQEEAEKTVRRHVSMTNSHHPPRWSHTWGSRWQSASTSAATGLLHVPSCARQSPSTVGFLYADISALFAKAHARNYFTYTRDSIVRRIESTSSRRRERRARTIRTPSILPRHSTQSASKRLKALKLEQKRLANYTTRQPAHRVEQLLKQGQYRSLRRRVFNLEHWDATHLDLRNVESASSMDLQLIPTFAALDRTTYPELGRHTRKLTIQHDPQCVRLSNRLFGKAAGTRRIQQLSLTWTELNAENRRLWAYPLLAYLLDRKPGRALDFIQILASDLEERSKKWQILADALGHLSRLHVKGSYDIRQGWNHDSKVNRQTFVPGFLYTFRKTLSNRSDVCSQDLLYNIATIADIPDLKQVFDSLAMYRIRLGFDTLLHYATAFGQAGEFKYALRCLEELKTRSNAIAWPILVDRQRLRWTSALILRKSMSQSQNYHDTPAIVATFVQLGIKMDILLYNVVMRNAMEAGDYAVAFQVYNALEGNGLKPDKHTFSILLSGCTSQSNPAMFHDFAEYCAEVAMEIRDPWLATDYLYYLYVRQQNHMDIEQFSVFLWQKYLQIFAAAPLEPFISVGRQYLKRAIAQQASDSEAAVLEPTPMAVYVMLQMEIKFAAASSVHRVLSLYEQFKFLVAKGSSATIGNLAQNATIWNAFLLAFCQKNQFASANQVIEDMTEGPVKPNVYTWNIFMQAFFKTGQFQAADRVAEIMRSRGVDPDQFSYGVLIRGYVKAQLIDRIGQMMEHLETEDEMDPDLLRALNTVVNRKRLMLALEKSKLDKENKAAEEARKLAEEERQRWAFPLGDDDMLNTPHGTDVDDERERENVIPASMQQSRQLSVAFERAEIEKQSLETEHNQTNRVPSPHQDLPTESPLDHPEHDHIMLQEELDDTSSTSPSSKRGYMAKTRVSMFGANVGYKSTISDNQDVAAVGKELPRFRIRRILQDQVPRKAS